MSNLSAALKELAGPRFAGDPVKRAVERASRLCGMPYWRCYDIWYCKNRQIEESEEIAIMEALAKRRKLVARNEIADLRTRLATLEAKLMADDPEFHSEDIRALRESVRVAR